MRAFYTLCATGDTFSLVVSCREYGLQLDFLLVCPKFWCSLNIEGAFFILATPLHYIYVAYELLLSYKLYY